MSVDTPRFRFPTLPTALSGVVARTVNWMRAVAFWVSVTLPWVVIGLVISGRLFAHLELFAALLSGTVCCAFLGRNYRRSG